MTFHIRTSTPAALVPVAREAGCALRAAGPAPPIPKSLDVPAAQALILAARRAALRFCFMWALVPVALVPIALVLAALMPMGAQAAAASSPIGLWKTIDDKTGRERALVRVYDDHGLLFGRIERSFVPGAETRVCAVCSDERRGQPIIGLLIIRNMKADGADYSGGDILDPESGSVYRCRMHVEQDGSRLVVRGYIGFALLGRSQTWQRQN